MRPLDFGVCLFSSRLFLFLCTDLLKLNSQSGPYRLKGTEDGGFRECVCVCVMLPVGVGTATIPATRLPTEPSDTHSHLGHHARGLKQTALAAC